MIDQDANETADPGGWSGGVGMGYCSAGALHVLGALGSNNAGPMGVIVDPGLPNHEVWLVPGVPCHPDTDGVDNRSHPSVLGCNGRVDADPTACTGGGGGGRRGWDHLSVPVVVRHKSI